MPPVRRYIRAALLVLLLAVSGCGLWHPGSGPDYEPGRLPLGELTVGVWLPAGLDEFRFGAADQERLLDLGVNWVEWLQPAVLDSATAEQIAMAFCSRAGLRMPVYYEPRGFSPDDKLHDWVRASPGTEFADQVRQRMRALLRQWEGEAGFSGYLVGHEDYRPERYPALRQLLEVLRQEDPRRPAYIVGRLDKYPAVDRFLDAFFAEDGAPNVFQHEHYVFRADLPVSGGEVQRRLDELAAGYDRVARKVQGRHGRWHAIVQAHAETRNGMPFYRRPTGAELRVQVGLALSRGASGIVYFLHSSGMEEVRDSRGQMVQRRLYEGLVDRQGRPTAAYAEVRRLADDLGRLGPVLEDLHFHGGFSHRRWMVNPLLRQGDEDLEFGLFGDGAEATHLLVVNRRTEQARSIELEVAREPVADAATGELLAVAAGRVRLELAAGGFRLLRIGGGE